MFYGILCLYVIIYAQAIDIKGQITRLKKSYSPRPFKSCFEHLGCLNTDEIWYHEIRRPINLEPLDRHTIKTEFILIKPSNGSRGKSTANSCPGAGTNGEENQMELLYDVMSSKKETVEIAGFKKGGACIFLIHDFTSNGFTGWVKHVARVAYPKISNVISVDWEAGAEPPFEQAVANARVVALEANIFITVLIKDFGIDPKRIHLVGHGVGAHIAGYIGTYLKTIDRITGLDPTGPYFEGMPNDVKLDRGDAKFVEIIHTNAFEKQSQGAKELMGHVDFFVNGADHQPGCNFSASAEDIRKITRNHLKEGKILPGCSHKRSFKYFIESMEPTECEFIGISCPSYEKFLNNECYTCSITNGTNGCAVMGWQTPRLDGKGKMYFVETRSESPFCMLPYTVTVTISESSKHAKGKFEIILVNEKNELANASLSIQNVHMREHQPGKSYSAVYYASPPKVTTVKEARVKWIHKNNPLCIVFCDNSIHIKEITVTALSVSKPSPINHLCPVVSNAKISSGAYVQFMKCSAITSPKGANRESATKKMCEA